MKRCIFLFALLLLLGCQERAQPPAVATNTAGAPASPSTPPTVKSALIDRVWARTDSGGPPGMFRIFLANGTQVLDSCWETYRLSDWKMVSDSTLLWREDGMDIRAEVVALDQEALVLRLRLVGGNEDEHYRVAAVPYVCPDMPR